MSTEVKVSIIIPVYRSYDFLPQLFERLLNQTLYEIEVIIINDGSPDDSGVLCDEFASRDNRVVVIHKENEGAAKAVQKGLELAQGVYTMFLDADDWIDYETCYVAYEAARRIDADMVLWGHYKEFNNESLRVMPAFKSECVFLEDSIHLLKRRFFGLLGLELKKPFETDAISMVWSKLYRTSMLKENSISFIDTSEVGSTDVLFNIQIAKFLNRAIYLNKFFNHYRQNNPTSLTKNYKFTLLEKFLKLFSQIEREVMFYNGALREEIQEAYNNRIVCSLINLSLNTNSKLLDVPLVDRYRYLKTAITRPTYQNALNQFSAGHLPVIWKLFFFLAQRKQYVLFFAFGYFLYRIRNFRLKLSKWFFKFNKN